MEADEVAPIESQDRPPISRGLPENRFIRPGNTGMTGLGNSENVVTQLAQPFGCRQREVLISKEAMFHRLTFVSADRLCYLLRMQASITPRIAQIVGTQHRVSPQQIGFGTPEFFGAHQ